MRLSFLPFFCFIRLRYTGMAVLGLTMHDERLLAAVPSRAKHLEIRENVSDALMPLHTVIKSIQAICLLEQNKTTCVLVSRDRFNVLYRNANKTWSVVRRVTKWGSAVMLSSAVSAMATHTHKPNRTTVVVGLRGRLKAGLMVTAYCSINDIRPLRANRITCSDLIFFAVDWRTSLKLVPKLTANSGT